MKLIKNPLIPFKGFTVINLLGFLFVRKDIALSPRILTHESIHTAQMQELGYIVFYIWYVVEWAIKLFKYGRKAYENISFEREAYTYQYDSTYLKRRKHYAWFRRL